MASYKTPQTNWINSQKVGLLGRIFGREPKYDGVSRYEDRIILDGNKPIGVTGSWPIGYERPYFPPNYPKERFCPEKA